MNRGDAGLALHQLLDAGRETMVPGDRQGSLPLRTMRSILIVIFCHFGQSYGRSNVGAHSLKSMSASS